MNKVPIIISKHLVVFRSCALISLFCTAQCIYPVYVTNISVGQADSQKFFRQCELPKEGKIPLFVLYGKEEKINIDAIDEEIRFMFSGDEVDKHLDVIIGFEDNTLNISNNGNYLVTLLHSNKISFIDKSPSTQLSLDENISHVILISPDVFEKFEDFEDIKSCILTILDLDDSNAAQELVNESLARSKDSDEKEMKVVIFFLKFPKAISSHYTFYPFLAGVLPFFPKHFGNFKK